MIKITTKENIENIIKMRDMKPLQIGIIVDDSVYTSHVVMRTANTDTFEVMDLTKASANGCWSCKNDLLVKLFNEPILLEITNDL